MKIRNPRTGDYDFEIKITDTDRLSEQAKNSRAAQQKWSNKTLDERILALQKLKNSLIKNGEINGKIAKELFEIVYSEGGEPAEIVEKRGMKQVTDTVAIEKAVAEIISANPDQVEKAKLNPKLVGWFVGQVMKATGGKANPKTVNELVAAKLNS